MALINYDYFQESLNKKLFEDSYSDLIKKIAEYPERYIGLFRPTKPKTKLIQNITQSHEIRFGDALEFIFERYFETLGFTILPKTVLDAEGITLNIDQLFEKDNIIYLIEQKVRDDHDSTKKRGQFNNFENKYSVISSIYPDKTVIPIMWFIDDSLTKNRNYYKPEMERMSNDYGCTAHLFYGSQLFAEFDGIDTISSAMWDETLEYLQRWKETLPDMPEINFDINADDVFEELKDMNTSIFRKLFTNDDIVSQIFPIIFPDGTVLRKLRSYFVSKYGTIYRTLVKYIDAII
jgi:hypothetical protein